MATVFIRLNMALCYAAKSKTLWAIETQRYSVPCVFKYKYIIYLILNYLRRLAPTLCQPPNIYGSQATHASKKSTIRNGYCCCYSC